MFRKPLIPSLIIILLFSTSVFAHLTGKTGHEKMLYPIVRVAPNQYSVGSGTLIYSKTNGKDGCVSTYILTNYHVISAAISISDVWDSALQKKVKKERRSTCYVEIFKYRDLSTPVGTMKLEADLVIYNEHEDMALLKLRYEEPIDHVAKLPAKDKTREYRVLDEAVAAGCSLGWPPLVSVGRITRISYLIDSLAYDMSSAQIIFGNSGGAMFTGDGTFIGIPSKVALQGWATAVAHMGMFIPVYRVYEWLSAEHYDFLYDPERIEKVCLEEREKEIEAKKAAEK